MSTFTENYNLIKPGEEDYYDVQDFNENMDTIDGQMAETERELKSISEKIGTSTQGNSIFQLLEKGEAEAYYRPADTVQKSYQNVTLATNTGGMGMSTGVIKLATFYAKHNGSIRISYDTTGTASSNSGNYFKIFEGINHEVAALTDCVFTKVVNANSPDVLYQAATNQWTANGDLHFPVRKGHIYVFAFVLNNTYTLTLNSFKICFDTVSAENITEFA